jgi:hypothetical protein
MASLISTYDETGPFGNPEGHRTDIQSAFVEIDAAVTATGLSSRAGDRSARVIVGRKGSGKTIYLRRFEASTLDEHSVHSSRIDPNPPSTPAVVQFCQWYRGEDLTERWSMAWRAAILRSVCSHVLFHPALAEYGTPVALDGLHRVARILLKEVSTPRSVHNQMGDLIGSHRSGAHLDRTLRSPEWGNLEYWLSEFLPTAPPMFFYLDAIDEEYASAPNYWLRCQKGLFFQVMRLLRDPVFGGRLHVIIALRDNVLASVMRGEHATRYRADPHIRVLGWNRPAIGYFLREKLARLPAADFMDERSGASSVSAWLGQRTIRNVARGLDEDLEDYLLRHTRLLPRDVVLLGNELAKRIAHAKERGLTAVPPDEIRRTVGEVARWCGEEQLTVCANQILGDLIPPNVSRGGDVETYIGSDEYRRDSKDRVESLVRSIGRDQFGTEALADLDARARDELGSAIDLPTVLWQNGLIGFRDARKAEDEWTFHGVEDVDRFHVPLDRDLYALHPCLLDALGLSGEGQGSQPVRPWRAAV